MKNIKGTLIALFIVIGSQFKTLHDIHVRNENFVMLLFTGLILGVLIQQIFDIIRNRGEINERH